LRKNQEVEIDDRQESQNYVEKQEQAAGRRKFLEDAGK